MKRSSPIVSNTANNDSDLSKGPYRHDALTALARLLARQAAADVASRTEQSNTSSGEYDHDQSN